jgi:hypothetical protein
MPEVKKRISAKTSLVDELFSKNLTSGYHLSMQAGTDGFSFCILDIKTAKFIVLEVYDFHDTMNFERIAETVSEIINENEILKGTFQSVCCAVVHGKSTLVPAVLYSEDQKSSFMRLNFPVETGEEILTNNLKILEAKNIFAISEIFSHAIRGFFPNVSFIHHSSSLLEGILGLYKNQQTKKLIVHIQPSRFEVLAVNSKELLFYNSFKHQTSEDFLYYVLFVCEQLKLNPETIELILFGEVERNSALFEITHKYVRHVHFGERSDSFEYSYKFNHLPEHFYYNLFSQYLTL